MSKTKTPAPDTAKAGAGALLDTARARVREGVSAVHEALAGIREELERRRGELHAARSVPPTRAEAEARVYRAVGALAAGVVTPNPLVEARPEDAVRYTSDVPAARLLAAMMPDAVKNWMMAPLDAAVEARGGWSQVSPEARRAEIQRLEIEILELESAEARAIKAAVESGVNFDYFPTPPREAGTYDASGQRVG